MPLLLLPPLPPRRLLRGRDVMLMRKLPLLLLLSPLSFPTLTLVPTESVLVFSVVSTPLLLVPLLLTLLTPPPPSLPSPLPPTLLPPLSLPLLSLLPMLLLLLLPLLLPARLS